MTSPDERRDIVGELGFDPSSDEVLSLLSRADTIERVTASWDPKRRAAITRYIDSHMRREALRRKYAHPAEIALACDPSFVMTPAIEHVSKYVERCIVEPRRNLIVTMPPQEGKSTIVDHYGVIRALQHDPNHRVVLATYGDTLAEDQSYATRSIIQSHGANVIDPITQTPVEDRIGLEISQDSRAVKRWRLKGYRGGLVAVGIGSPITGRSADLLIVDDPFKSMQDADSRQQRENVWSFMQSVAETRLSASASIVVIQTRWVEDDLAGRLIAADRALPQPLRSWKTINIPLRAEDGVPDALDRIEGEYLRSATGKTPEWYESKRRAVGERVYYALYQGVPRPTSGGLFSTEWFDVHKIDEIPNDNPVATIVGVDPAETGNRDEAGVMAGSTYLDRVTGERRHVLTHDRSGLMTSDKWARAAVLLAVEVGASEISIESYTTGNTYKRIVVETYKRLVESGEIQWWAGRPAPPMPPFLVRPWRGQGDALARSAPLRQAVEVGTLRVLGGSTGPLSRLVDQAVGWQQGQHQPDRVAAALIVHDRLTGTTVGESSFGSPVAAQRRAGAHTSEFSRSAMFARKVSK